MIRTNRANRKDIAQHLRHGSADIADTSAFRPANAVKLPEGGPKMGYHRGAFDMLKTLAFSFALALTAASAQMMRPGQLPPTSNVIRVGLDEQPNQPVSLEEICKDVSFTRDIKYGDNDRNTLDVATTNNESGESRPVLLFVAGQHFANEGDAPAANPL